MTMLVVFYVCLFLLALLFIVIGFSPWFFSGNKKAASNHMMQMNVLLFKQRLQELTQDVAQKKITQIAYEQQKIELEKQLLAADADRQLFETTTTETRSNKKHLYLLSLCLSCVFVMTYHLLVDKHHLFNFWKANQHYASLADDLLSGRQKEPPTHFFEKATNNPQATNQKLQQLVQVMQAKVHQHSNSSAYWLTMSGMYATLEQPNALLQAIARAQYLAPENTALAITYAQTTLFTTGKLDAPAKQVVLNVLKKTPTHEGAHMLMLMNAMKTENYAQANDWLKQLKKILIKKGANNGQTQASIDELSAVIAKKLANNNSN